MGKIESMENGRVHIQAPDGAKVVVQGNSQFTTPFVEVTGTVVDPMTIQAESHTEFGDNFGEGPMRAAGGCWLWLLCMWCG